MNVQKSPFYARLIILNDDNRSRRLRLGYKDFGEYTVLKHEDFVLHVSKDLNYLIYCNIINLIDLANIAGKIAEANHVPIQYFSAIYCKY